MQQKREEFERHIREQEDELLQQEYEFKERQKRQAEEEGEQESLDSCTTSGWLLYDHSSPQDSALDALDMDTSIDTMCPDSKPQQQQPTSVILSPVPGWISWDLEVSEIELVKGKEGLGFSLLDFSVR